MGRKKQQSDRIVYCQHCRFAEVYKSEISRSVDTGEYFMCKCLIGDAPRDTFRLNFIHKPRVCDYYVPKD